MFPLTSQTTAYGITSGPDGNIWFGDGQLGRVIPSSGAISQFPIPAGRGIAVGPDGNFWLTTGSSITEATLSPTETDMVVTQQPPTTLAAGSAFSVTVQAEDASGNLLTSYNGMVTLALANNPAGDTLGGTTTVQASGGVAAFTGLTLTRASAGDTLVATSGLSAEGYTSAITVNPTAASQLVITTQPPATVKLNSQFGLQASIEDPYGNVVTTASNPVSVAFSNNPAGATLGGTLSVAASQGVATFSNLAINKVGNGYTLQVTSSGLTSAVSTTINVTKTGKIPDPGVPSSAGGSPSEITPLLFDIPGLWPVPGLKKRGRSST
jgi:hypothetical protein